jgi:AraC-like DNA-binding protein
MLLRDMPDLSPANRRYRAWFYGKWGRENCLILGCARFAEYGRYTQRLSIKMASGGRERYFVDGRSVAVDDDNYLILNDGRTYSSLIDASNAVESFSIFFRPGLLEGVLGVMNASEQRMLEVREESTAPRLEFDEHLTPHNRSVTPVMQFIRHHIRQGLDDEHWYEEQLHFLAERMLIVRQRAASQLHVATARATTRHEILRRLRLATDFVHANYEQDIGLDAMARSACMSRHHFLRLFRQVHGVTPLQFLHRKRIGAALRLMGSTQLTMQEIAARVGFTSRATFYRQLQRWGTQARDEALRRTSG